MGDRCGRNRADGRPKTPFLTERLAVDTCQAAAGRGVILHQYQCGHCGSWHTASGPSRHGCAHDPLVAS